MFIFEISQNRPGSIWICSRDNVQNMVGIMYSFGLSRDNVQNIEAAHQVGFLVMRSITWKHTRWAAILSVFNYSAPPSAAVILIAVSGYSGAISFTKPINFLVHNLKASCIEC